MAFGVGIISACSLPLGALTSFLWRLEERVVAAMMAFGGGALLAALTLDLVAPALAQGHHFTLFAGFLTGGALFIGLDRLVMHLCRTDNIRDVIAFPKTQTGADLMSQAPNLVDDDQLKELHVASTWTGDR